MTNLLYALNTEALSAVTVTASSTESGYSANDLITGGRWERWLAESDTAHTIKYNFGSAVTPNVVALCRADLCVKDDATVSFKVEYSTNDSDWSEWFDETVATTDLVGPNGEDWVYYDSTQTEAAQYWRLTITYSGAGTPELSKFFIGAALDFDREPVSFSIRKTRTEDAQHKPLMDIHAAYTGIDYNTAVEFLDSVGSKRECLSGVAFTTTDHGLLLGAECVHFEIADIRAPQTITDHNNIQLWIRELI